MTFEHILALFGGLALFLYGMHMMSVGLEAFAGNKMKGILEKLTNNPIIGVLVGTIITAIIQSSSATTVMVVGFVNSGLMTLQQAVWIIMGANIGTTITGVLVALAQVAQGVGNGKDGFNLIVGLIPGPVEVRLVPVVDLQSFQMSGKFEKLLPVSCFFRFPGEHTNYRYPCGSR